MKDLKRYASTRKVWSWPHVAWRVFAAISKRLIGSRDRCRAHDRQLWPNLASDDRFKQADRDLFWLEPHSRGLDVSEIEGHVIRPANAHSSRKMGSIDLV